MKISKTFTVNHSKNKVWVTQNAFFYQKGDALSKSFGNTVPYPTPKIQKKLDVQSTFNVKNPKNLDFCWIFIGLD
jgi:hypothetical protein